MSIVSLKNRLSKLPTKVKCELIEFLKNSYSVFDEYSNISNCPHCQSPKIVKNGIRNDIQRFLCKNCKKNFNYKTNTVISGIIHLDKWNTFVEDFMSLNLTSLDELKLKLDVTGQTVFNWRHKLLSALSTSDLKFTNEELEFDETFFLISRKGRQNLSLGKNRSWYRHWRKGQVGDSNYNVKVFFTYGRTSKQLELYQSHMGRTSALDLEKYILPSKFQSVLFYTDSHRSYGKFFKQSPYEHKIFKGKQHVSLNDRNIHNQTVNAYTRDFKNFVNRTLKGVSTKYLNNYVKWYQFINEVKNIVRKKLNDNVVKFNITDKICKEIVSDKKGLELFRQTEYSFLKFLEQNQRTNYGDCKNHYYK